MAATTLQGADAAAPEAGECPDRSFGARDLEAGDCGDDVRTLNWILRSKRYAKRVRIGQVFRPRTETAVRQFERREDIAVNGAVGRSTRRRLVRSLPKQRVSYYDGARGACGDALDTMGVAHRTLPCGTKVAIGYKGRWVRVRVVDRGPKVWTGRDWDVTETAARELRILTIGVVNARYAIAKRGTEPAIGDRAVGWRSETGAKRAGPSSCSARCTE